MAGTRKQVLQPTTWGIIMTTWTVDVVEEWIVIATKVDRALPPVRMRRVRAQCFYGTDTESLLWDLLNEDMKNIEPRFQPTRHTGMRRYKQALATLTAELNRLPQSKK